MRKASWTPRRDRLVCPLCEVGKLLRSGQGSARCTLCASFVSRTMLEVLQCIIALPDAEGSHACEECDHPEMRHLPNGVFHCPGCGSELLSLNTSFVARKPALDLGGHSQLRSGCGTGRAYATRRVGPSPSGTAGAGRDRLSDADLGDSLMVSNLIETRRLVQVRAPTTISKARR
jgi:ribosomal protein L37AE/L43A